MNKKNLAVGGVFLFLAAGIILRVFYMADLPFSDWDEGIYAQVAKEILQKKSIDTTFNNTIWLNKPPFSHILIALSFSLFGLQEVPARLIFALFGILSLYLVFRLGEKILRVFFKEESSHLPLLPVLILASSPIFLERSSTLNTDIIIAVAYLGYFLSLGNFAAKTAFLLLGVYSKSLVGFFPLFIEPILWLRDKNPLSNIGKKILALLLQIFLASLWYIYAYAKYGQYFVKAHFMDQIFKRVVAPIELHFGNKWYYFQLLWENLGFIAILLGFSYLILGFDFLRDFLRKRFWLLKERRFAYYSILFAPLGFFALLVVGRSKIYWYILFILPLMLLALLYAFGKIKSKKIRLVFVLPIVVFAFYRFYNQTFLFRPEVKVAERLRLGLCLREKGVKELAFLVDEDERKIRNVLEAAQLQTETSFVYGGSPAFVFYLDRPLKYFYKLDEFASEYKDFQAVALAPEDQEKIDLSEYRLICQSEGWRGYIRK